MAMKNRISEGKNTLQGIKSRPDKADQNSNLEDKVGKNTHLEQQNEIRF